MDNSGIGQEILVPSKSHGEFRVNPFNLLAILRRGLCIRFDSASGLFKRNNHRNTLVDVNIFVLLLDHALSFVTG